MSNINLRKYTLPSAMTATEAYESLTGNAASCPQIKSIAVRQSDNEPILSGGWFKYTADVEKDEVKVKPKMDVTKSMILTIICLPFALWFVWGTNLDAPDLMGMFRQAALPLAWMFISVGLVYTIAYLLGGKEQKSVLSFIYTTLNKNSDTSAADSGSTGMGASYFFSVITLIIGIVILILHFVLP